MANDVVSERDILHDGPRGGPALVAHREKNREAVLGSRPVVLEDVSIDEYTLGVLQLEEILDLPRAALPTERLEDVVAAYLDIRWHEIRDRRICSAEHDVFAGRFHVVVRDLERPGAIPATSGLRVGADFMNF